MYNIRADRPVDAVTLSILRDFDGACRKLGVEYFLVGATARDIMLTHVFGIEAGRITRDVDLAVAIADWQVFDRIKTCLLAQASNWAVSPAPQRLLYRDGDALFATSIDLIPFGKVENPPGAIAWPPDMAVVMHVTGYAEAHQSAAQVKLGDGRVIRVASIAGLAALKLFAWVDRGMSDSKDAHDLLILLRRYTEAGNHDRLYEPGNLSLLEFAGYDPDLAGAGLLGADVALMVDQKTRAKLLAILNDGVLLDRLMLHMARSYRAEDALSRIGDLLRQFKNGMIVGA